VPCKHVLTVPVRARHFASSVVTQRGYIADSPPYSEGCCAA
jgi:hypothetical protein